MTYRPNATERKHKDTLEKHGYELVFNRDEHYYYLTPLTDTAPQIKEQGLYGMQVTIMTVEEMEKELLDRIEEYK